MKICGIDPGPTQSGITLFCTETRFPVSSDKLDNDRVRELLYDRYLADLYVIEGFQFYSAWKGGKQVHAGKDSHKTLEEIGMLKCMLTLYNKNHFVVTRPAILGAVAGKRNASKQEFNTALKQQLASWHGVPVAEVEGTKANPGPMYGVGNQHKRDALGAALYGYFTNEKPTPGMPMWARMMLDEIYGMAA